MDGDPRTNGDDPDVAVVDREFGCSADDLWEALIDPETLGEWMGGEADVQPEPGYEGTVDLPPEEGGRHVVYVEEVERGRRLRFRWASQESAPSQVTFDVETTESGSRLIVTELQVPPGLAVARFSAQASCRGLVCACLTTT